MLLLACPAAPALLSPPVVSMGSLGRILRTARRTCGGGGGKAVVGQCALVDVRHMMLQLQAPAQAGSSELGGLS